MLVAAFVEGVARVVNGIGDMRDDAHRGCLCLGEGKERGRLHFNHQRAGLGMFG